MKNKLLLFFIILFYSCQNADINDVDKRNENWIYWIDSISGKASWIPVGKENNVKDGRYTSFYANGSIYEKGKLKNSLNIDTIYCYNLKGNIIEYKLILKDTLIHYYIKNGPYIAYYQNEKIYEKGIIKNHKKGDELIQYNEKGGINYIKKFKNGTGAICWYYENGQISDSNYYNKNKVQGQVKRWYENGQIKETSNWNDDVQNGIYETFYKDGNPKQKNNYLNGKRNGIAEEWYENGNRKFVHFFKNGILDGNIKQWYSNGNIQFDANYSSGLKNGKESIYFENGGVQIESYYKNGQKDGI